MAKRAASRRAVLRGIGATIGGSAFATPLATTNPNSTERNATAEGEDETIRATTRTLSNATGSFSPWAIGSTESTTFRCSWDVFLPFGISAHRLDAHIEAARIERPEIRAIDIGARGIRKQWTYEPDPSPSGIDDPTYHLKVQRYFGGLPGSTQTVNAYSKITPTTSGDVAAWIGGQFGGGNLGNGFAGATLDVR